MFGPSSETVSFRTKDQVDYTCGDGSTDVEAIRLRLEQASKVPLSFAPAGTIVQVGAFEMTITAAQNLGGGHFSGEGTVSLAFLGGMNYQVTFDDLLINEDLIGLDGDLDFVSAMDGYFAQQEIPRLPDGLFLKLYEHLEKIWANREKPRKYEQEVASALEEFKKEMAGITDSVALGKAKEVYGQMEGLGDPSLSKEEKKAKVLQLADSSTPDFSVLESPPEESLLVSVKTMADWLRLMRKLAVDSWECVTPEAKKFKWNAGGDEIYNAIIKTGLCVTDQSKTDNLNGIAKYNYGLTNSLLQMVDVQAMTEGIEIAQEALKEGFKRSGSCLAKQLFLVLINEEDARERYVAQYRDCFAGGYNLAEGFSDALKYIDDNYQDAYFQGQATGFVLSLALPTKLGVAAKAARSEEVLAIVAQKTAKGFPKESAALAKAASKSGINEGELLGKLSNKDVRVWYNQQLEKINTQVAFTEDNARVLSAQRARLKKTARDMMADKNAAVALDKDYPVQNFEYYKKKYSKQGYEGEALWEKIIKGSETPNAEVN